MMTMPVLRSSLGRRRAVLLRGKRDESFILYNIASSTPLAIHSSRANTSCISAHPQKTWRTFSTTPRALKKGGKAAREDKHSAGSGDNAATESPSDFSALESDIANVLERLKTDLSKLRAGGRFNPQVLEDLRVQPDKRDNATFKLGELAQVIPKGRTVQLIVGEKDHVKPISSTIMASTLSLTPQSDPTGHNPLLLVVQIPPPTAESRRSAVNEAAKAGEKAGMALRDARGKQQKKLRAMQIGKSARPDDLKKAGAQMEKIVENATTEVKKTVDKAKKVLEEG